MRRLSFILVCLILLICIQSVACADDTINLLDSVGGDIAILSGSISTPGSVLTVRGDPRDGYRFDHWEYQKKTENGQLVTQTTTDNPISLENYARAARAVFVSAQQPQVPQTQAAEQQVSEQSQYNASPYMQYQYPGQAQYSQTPIQQYQYSQTPAYQYQPQQQPQGSYVQSVPQQSGAQTGTGMISLPQTGAASAVAQQTGGQQTMYQQYQQPSQQAYPTGYRYVVTYRPGIFGTGNSVTTIWDYGYAVLTGQLYKRDGYTQTGWSISDGGGKTYNLNQQIPLDRNLNLYPYWQPSSIPLTLTVTYNGNGAVRSAGGLVSNGWTGQLQPGQAYTFNFAPYNGFYVYSINLAGTYRTIQSGNQFTVTYDMLQGRNQTLIVRYESIYHSPKTGDDVNIAMWMALGTMSAIGLAFTCVTVRRKIK